MDNWEMGKVTEIGGIFGNEKRGGWEGCGTNRGDWRCRWEGVWGCFS